jgi:putative addiction module killer protein
MVQFMLSLQFKSWLKSLSDARAKARIIDRIDAAEAGNFGDCAPVGEGVSEMRIHYGPGYRLYYTRKGKVVYLLLVGGDKSTQSRDIKRAIAMAKEAGKEKS